MGSITIMAHTTIEKFARELLDPNGDTSTSVWR